MANKFQKSVLERLEHESVRQHVGERKPELSQSPENKVPVEEKPIEKKNIVSKPITKNDVIQAAETPDLSQFLQVAPSRKAKNKTFYLDTEVIEAIHTAAKSQRVADSKLVNDILKRILLG